MISYHPKFGARVVADCALVLRDRFTGGSIELDGAETRACVALTSAKEIECSTTPNWPRGTDRRFTISACDPVTGFRLQRWRIFR